MKFSSMFVGMLFCGLALAGDPFSQGDKIISKAKDAKAPLLARINEATGETVLFTADGVKKDTVVGLAQATDEAKSKFMDTTLASVEKNGKNVPSFLAEGDNDRSTAARHGYYYGYYYYPVYFVYYRPVVYYYPVTYYYTWTYYYSGYTYVWYY